MSKPKAKIDREEIKSVQQIAQSKELMATAAKVLCPIDFEHQASVVCHFYRHRRDETYAFMVHQIGLGKIPEPQADAGFKEMMRAMMSVYGREAPKVRTDV